MPALSICSNEQPEVYVLELSSFQLETTDSLRATGGRAAQRERRSHGSLRRIFDQYARDQGAASSRAAAPWCCVNRDDARVAAMARAGRRR